MSSTRRSAGGAFSLSLESCILECSCINMHFRVFDTLYSPLSLSLCLLSISLISLSLYLFLSLFLFLFSHFHFLSIYLTHSLTHRVCHSFSISFSLSLTFYSMSFYLKNNTQTHLIRWFSVSATSKTLSPSTAIPHGRLKSAIWCPVSPSANPACSARPATVLTRP